MSLYPSAFSTPQVVRKMLPSDALEVFRRAANAASDTGTSDNDAIAAGWSEVRKGWHRHASQRKWVKMRKDGPTASDVHVDGPIGGKKKKPKAPDDIEKDTSMGGVVININQAPTVEAIERDLVGLPVVKIGEKVSFTESHRGRIVKVDEARKICYGWANVITEGGAQVVDTQDDGISPGEMVRFTTEFMMDQRIGKTNHAGEPTHMVVHSMPLTYELAKAFGIETPDEGWLVGVYIHDQNTLAAVQAGELAAFSIGGSGERRKAT